MDDVYIFGVPWQEIVDWFLAQPLYGQILVLIGAVAVLALAVIIAYYVIKGIAYLIYYLLKGIYYLLKGIGLLFYKLFEAFYYAISGKEKPEAKKQEQQVVNVIQQPVQRRAQPIPKKVVQIVDPEATYCTECGNEFSVSMAQQLHDKGFVYCIHCGKGFKSNYMQIEAQ